MDPREIPEVPKDPPDEAEVEAVKLLNLVAFRTLSCEHWDRQLFCRTQLEAEVAGLLRRVGVK